MLNETGLFKYTKYSSFGIFAPSKFNMKDTLAQLKIKDKNPGLSTGTQWFSSKGETIVSFSPVDGKQIGQVTGADRNGYDQVLTKAQQAFVEWRMWPSPKRGDVIRQIGDALRINKEPLGRLVSYE